MTHQRMVLYTLPDLGHTMGYMDETGLGLAAVFRMVTLPSPKSSDNIGASVTACPAREGEESAIVEAAIDIKK